MKTWRDFNVEQVIKLIRKSEKNITEERIEELMDDACELLTVNLSCLTCGKRFPMNNMQHKCKEEDIWLYQYIQNSVGNKQVKKEYLSLLKEKYPLHKGHDIAYRGINFKTHQEYRMFMESLKENSFTFKEITSWTLRHDYAVRFARCIQKGTRENDDIRKQEIRAMFNMKANITGYKGIILAIHLTKNKVLCDISKEGIGNMTEEEVILLPGTYQVVLNKIIDKELGKTDWNEENIRLAELLI
ncbi:hypothetical protein PP175_28395 (plasmid) [Aneurinibacillus sp. Ricciae_BoGa-3]|uniref:hypothetical protein n=1 Tax=Aneurinibacillus sp. Ricciae_BoGa-3 TaxID=3022697 RepID=UPI0023409803|nr:hypothetical protein [Aneurinibacillus sp. Ricciae_BoGa-3]WCK57112.1 hypothetical protein PP175_28395 [Aneurinibacillus sp. Ricciae_BoGa-3]